MITLDEIRKDLSDVRYYYKRKEMFDAMLGKLHNPEASAMLAKVERYNEAVSHVPVRLIDLYIHLYMMNHTQAALANEWNYSSEYIRRLNKQLLLHLQKKLSENKSSA